MDKIILPVGKFRLVHRAVFLDKISGLCSADSIFDYSLVDNVDLFLRVLAVVKVSVSGNAALYVKESVKNKGISAVLIPSALTARLAVGLLGQLAVLVRNVMLWQLRIVFRGIQNLVAHKFAKMQNRFVA